MGVTPSNRRVPCGPSTQGLTPFPGGHTTELLRLLGPLSAAYSPRHYVIADTDEISARKIHAFELGRADRDARGAVSDQVCF